MKLENRMNKTNVTAPDIVCSGCAGAIKNALSRVSGVAAVEVDIDKKTVSVLHNEEVSREKIIEILDDAGFPSN
jgi:copper chaperone CopZ